MDDIRSRLWAQICPLLEGPARRAAAVVIEIRKRSVDAARDAQHRLRTGRARGGLPATYVHPPLPCSSACSKPAQRVHGLLYGYSLAYDEVRPRVETIAQVLGCGTSTVRNALTELRRAGLVISHERCGKDGRRLANRYEVRVSRAERAPLRTGASPSDGERTRREISDRRSKIENSRREPTVDAPRMPPGAAVPPSRTVAVSEEVLREAVGEECFRRLRSCFPEEFSDLLRVVAAERGLELPGVLRAACLQLLEGKSNIEKAPGYLRATLRAQRALFESLEREVAELGARRDGFRVAGERDRASQVGGEIAKLRRRQAEMRGEVSARPAGPVPTRPSPRAGPVDAVPLVIAPIDLGELLKGSEQVMQATRRAAVR